MYIVPIAWLYVVVMMSIAEATNTNGSLLGAFITFVLYGVVPVALILYFMAAPANVLFGPETRQNCRYNWPHRNQMQASCRPLILSRRWEKNCDRLLAVHHMSAPSLPNTWITPRAASFWRASPCRFARYFPLV